MGIEILKKEVNEKLVKCLGLKLIKIDYDFNRKEMSMTFVEQIKDKITIKDYYNLEKHSFKFIDCLFVKEYGVIMKKIEKFSVGDVQLSFFLKAEYSNLDPNDYLQIILWTDEIYEPIYTTNKNVFYYNIEIACKNLSYTIV